MKQLSKEEKGKVMVYKKYKGELLIGKYSLVNLLMKVIIRVIHIDSNTMTLFICNQLITLGIHVGTVGFNITKSNSNV